ncbi:MAG: hypothetical protein KAX13_02455 [Candidatus Krumholzibacteria bacterium]|nr:hypothetical protein [Candidatus Krumholzibacteria bacterium]
MKRNQIAVALVFILILAGCKAQHPSEVTMDPEFDVNQVGSILIAPFVSSIQEGIDPNRQSERIMNRTLLGMISERADHKFLSPEYFKLAIRKGDLDESYEKFKIDWMTKQEVDKAFLLGLKGELDIDAILIPHVYLWDKDEVDYRESGAASSTTVGATLTLVDFDTGKVLWEATDQNYEEAVRSEGNREQVSTAGITRRVSGVSATGKDMYAAPPYENVAILVLKVLVDAIPERGAM